MLTIWITLTWWFFLAAAHNGVVHYKEVSTSLGVVLGVGEYFQGTPLHIFRSIPYAQPPKADLRFLHPVPLEPWDGILNTTAPHPACIQPRNTQMSESPGDYTFNLQIVIIVLNNLYHTVSVCAVACTRISKRG